MPIVTNKVHFGEGISVYGTQDPHDAFRLHRKAIRIQRLKDAFPDKDKVFSIPYLVDDIDTINNCIAVADKQVLTDNEEFIEEHDIKI